jgi:putative exosortase-associated protein (TIGR04073 family)
MGLGLLARQEDRPCDRTLQVAALALPVGAFAHDSYGQHDHTAVGKLTRGLAGMTTGFLELPGNMVAVGREDGTFSGMTLGFAKGLGMIPVRELVGVYEFVTAPFPAPGHYEPVIEPQYPWSYFDGAPQARMSAAMRGESRRATSSTTSHSTSGAYE